MKKPTLSLYRNAEYVESLIQYYLKCNIAFKVKHSTYNTEIITDVNTQKFITHEFDNRVFIAFSMIQGDLKNSPNLDKVLTGDWKKINYDSQNGLPNIRYKTAVNLDITSAYPYCLYVNKLISEKTFTFLMQLPKNQRLPAIGMCAKKSTVISYEGGKAVSWDYTEYKYAPVFYFVINQITDLMEWAKDISGKYFLFYWVDGIFLKPTVTKKILKDIENILAEQGYYYKYESVENLAIERKENTLEIHMIKKGDFKHYKFIDRNLAKNFYKLLKNLADEKNPLQLHGATTRDLELSQGIQNSDFAEWME
jgi:hypothetical protein